MMEIHDANSHKLSGQYVRFTTCFETVLIYNMFRNDIDLQHVSERY